jgi:hypothetical protein
MVSLFAGFLVLVAVMMIGRWFIAAPPANIIKTFQWFAGLSLLGSGVLLAVSGRLGWALAALAGLIPWLMRMIQMHQIFRLLRARFRRTSGVHSASGGDSRVETRFLCMTLDHDSGNLSGTVMDGPFSGRLLSQLSFDEALELHRFCRADPQSDQLLEAWLDRTWSDWREKANPHSGEMSVSGSMSRQEAYEILGIAPNASHVAIKEAYQRLMVRLHPDHGGSNYLAAKINQAKDLLLKD